MLWYGVVPGAGYAARCRSSLRLIALAAVGVGTLLAALNVAYRDFRYVIPFLVQIWMFATPTVYMQPDSNGVGWMQTLLSLNPLTGLVSAFRAAVLGDALPWLHGHFSGRGHGDVRRRLPVLPPRGRQLFGHHLKVAFFVYGIDCL